MLLSGQYHVCNILDVLYWKVMTLKVWVSAKSHSPKAFLQLLIKCALWHMIVLCMLCYSINHKLFIPFWCLLLIHVILYRHISIHMVWTSSSRSIVSHMQSQIRWPDGSPTRSLPRATHPLHLTSWSLCSQNSNRNAFLIICTTNAGSTTHTPLPILWSWLAQWIKLVWC